MFKYNHPTLAYLLEYWTVTVFLPAILLLIAVLVATTWWQDGRDAAVAQQKARQAEHGVNVAEVADGPGQGPAAA